jgi:hypothetical protein
MSQSPTELFCRFISNEKFFFHIYSVCKTIGFFLTNKISNRWWNYRWTLYQQTHSIGELIIKIFIDKMVISRRQKNSIGKTVKCCNESPSSFLDTSFLSFLLFLFKTLEIVIFLFFSLFCPFFSSLVPVISHPFLAFLHTGGYKTILLLVVFQN